MARTEALAAEGKEREAKAAREVLTAEKAEAAAKAAVLMDLVNGQGTRKYRNGVYEGTLKDGLPHGQGTRTYGNGRVYKGEFQGGQRHGQGTLCGGTCNNYLPGEMHRHTCGLTNMMLVPDGYTYNGQWKGDQRHGQGEVTYSDGRVYSYHWEGGGIAI